ELSEDIPSKQIMKCILSNLTGSNDKEVE
ncbi:hypothetical protein MMJ09_26285, partial [Bacillus vallismortis]|nr:hypothetical protein [Bacillus vallismortis]